MRLQGQVGIVTGAGHGLCADVARALSAEGMALVSRTAADLEALADELTARGVPALACPLDVGDPSAAAGLVERVVGRLGPVDLLVNGAAAIESTERPFWQADPDELWRVVETDLRGPLLLTRAVLPGMVLRGAGRVVDLASRARAASATGTCTAHAVSERALTVLTESLGPSLSGTGVVVVDVLPGLVRTPMTAAMPVWRDVPDDQWDAARATAAVVVDVALGQHDDACGALLDAPALVRTAYGTIEP